MHCITVTGKCMHSTIVIVPVGSELKTSQASETTAWGQPGAEGVLKNARRCSYKVLVTCTCTVGLYGPYIIIRHRALL
jgi:hypothetical protein